ncbi:MAG TPA: nicotinate-nucleotide adenylyltransferase [Kiritimatiellia bacterium]|nr:nicotinate-nucleotide adenylyltransferase [Kiritimatiellia bacterium]HRU71059.1 nicotinate-nucleotide adenylyltransferase [Kiritimatiellia bacterium]
MRLGILGGSFNPIHIGHLLIGCAAAEAFQLDRVMLMPCAVSPFKVGASDLASGADRLEMVRRSIAGDPLFDVSDLELARGGVSYAVETVRALHDRYPEAQLFFIIGGDSLRELSRWHKVNEMLTLCDVITVQRPGVTLELDEALAPFPETVRDRLRQHTIHGRTCEVSSSEIRRRIAEGRSIRYLVCLEVEAYIRERGLYAVGT